LNRKRTVHEVAFRLNMDMTMQIAPRLGALDASLSQQQLRTMRLIWSHDQVTLVDIAQTLKRDKSQVVRLIDELSKADMVAREPNPKDGRSKILKLTPKGEAFFTKIEDIEAQFSDQLVDNIDPKDLDAFFKVADRLSENLKKIDSP